jgi:hypothetical protein
VQKLQDAAEQVMEHSFDYDVKIKSCDDVISALKSYLQKHSDTEWGKTAQTTLMSWQSRRDALQQELTSLNEKLSKMLAERAVYEAKMKHAFCNIEGIKLEKHDTRKDGVYILVKDNYFVRMKGALLGLDIFKLNVNVSGRISMDTKDVTVDENAIVEE